MTKIPLKCYTRTVATLDLKSRPVCAEELCRAIVDTMPKMLSAGEIWIMGDNGILDISTIRDERMFRISIGPPPVELHLEKVYTSAPEGGFSSPPRPGQRR